MSVEPRSPSLSANRVSMLVKVARLYHEHGVRQPEIAARLNLSQSRVSRLLKEAAEVGIVRTVIVPPPGSFTDLEERLRKRFALTDVVVVDAGSAEDAVVRAIGVAAAGYLDVTLGEGDRIGISSWSSSLLATMQAMPTRSGRPASSVVQLLGGVGAPGAQVQASRLIEGFAGVLGGAAHYFPVPGLVASSVLRDALLADASVTAVREEWLRLDVALVGIGALDPSPLLARSGNVLSADDDADLRRAGAVGDVCLRYFDAAGAPVGSGLDDRVLGIDRESLLAVPRRIGIAGGLRKTGAIRAALAGGWLTVLVTDAEVAAELLVD